MYRSSRRKVIAGFFLAALLAAVVFTLAPNPSRVVQAQGPLPPNQPERGLIYDGLEVPNDGSCPHAFRIRGTNLCTHGPDPVPLGFKVGVPAPLTTGPKAPSAPTAVCDGDGTTGKRIQVVYAYVGTSHYTSVVGNLQSYATQADQIFQDSAAETGGSRHVRFVTDASCTATVISVKLTATGDDSFDNTMSELRSLGLNRSDRKYLVFVDSSGPYCGIGTISIDDLPLATNASNYGPSYARVDNDCWGDAGGQIAAHEMMHNLGGVQQSAPHHTSNWHCFDENDRMCYDDGSGVAMQTVCTNVAHDRLFDCNHDDYFSTNPPVGNYLTTHWNTASNQFLIGACAEKPSIPVPSSPAFLATATQPQVALDWPDMNCATRYTVVVKQDFWQSWGVVVQRATSLTSSQFTTKSLAGGHYYFWRVKACDSAGCRPSQWWEFYVK